MRLTNLSGFVLEHIALASMEHADFAAQYGSRVFSAANSLARRLDPQHSNFLILDEWVEQSHRITPAADTSNQKVGQSSLFRQNLSPRLMTDDRLEVANHHRIRM